MFAVLDFLTLSSHLLVTYDLSDISILYEIFYMIDYDGFLYKYLWVAEPQYAKYAMRRDMHLHMHMHLHMNMLMQRQRAGSFGGLQ